MKGYLYILMCTVFFSACSTQLKRGAHNIYFVNDVSKCILKGYVSGSSTWGYGIEGNTENARNEILNNTYDLKANVIKITSTSIGVMNSTLEGIAYKCKSVYRNQIVENPIRIDYDHINRQRAIMLDAAATINKATFGNYTQREPASESVNDNTTSYKQKEFCAIDNFGHEGMCYHSHELCENLISNSNHYVGCSLRTN